MQTLGKSSRSQRRRASDHWAEDRSECAQKRGQETEHERLGLEKTGQELGLEEVSIHQGEGWDSALFITMTPFPSKELWLVNEFPRAKSRASPKCPLLDLL